MSQQLKPVYHPCLLGRVLYSCIQKKERNSRKRGGFLSSSSRFKDGSDRITPGNSAFLRNTDLKTKGIMFG